MSSTATTTSELDGKGLGATVAWRDSCSCEEGPGVLYSSASRFLPFFNVDAAGRASRSSFTLPHRASSPFSTWTRRR